MNTYEICMLYICFGAMAGTFIGQAVIAVLHIVEFIREKRRKRKEVT